MKLRVLLLIFRAAACLNKQTLRLHFWAAELHMRAWRAHSRALLDMSGVRNRQRERDFSFPP